MATIPSMRFALLLTCEHATCAIPAEYESYFRSRRAQRDLRHHRGFDPGALDVAQFLSDRTGAPLICGEVSRLLVDLNRSPHAPDLFSTYLQRAGATIRARILERYYFPYRQRVETTVAQMIAERRTALHLSIHTFTPILAGQRRDFDVGVLFDPDRELETQVSRMLLGSLREDGLRVELNRPYLGVDDGLTTYLRTRFPSTAYAGIELEVTNRIARFRSERRVRWCQALLRGIQQTAAQGGPVDAPPVIPPSTDA
ncbi:MAG: N-formylglutamate amidohydrolase [Planctomycetota bacterium]|nr:MAG: N-formylglutamate amidohydrolase [Planctomycetota bacterium]